MRREAELGHGITHLLKVVPFVKTEMLRVFWRRDGALDDNTLQGRTHKLHVVAICAVHAQSEWHAMTLSQQTTFDACFAAISGIGADFFPRPMAPWSLRRPYSSSPTRSPSTRQSAPHLLAINGGTRLLPPILESGHVPSNPDKSLFHPTLSTGSRCVTRRRFHLRIPDPASVVAHRQIDVDSRGLATAVAAPPTIHPRFGSWLSSCCLPLVFEFVHSS